MRFCRGSLGARLYFYRQQWTYKYLLCGYTIKEMLGIPVMPSLPGAKILSFLAQLDEDDYDCEDNVTVHHIVAYIHISIQKQLQNRNMDIPSKPPSLLYVPTRCKCQLFRCIEMFYISLSRTPLKSKKIMAQIGLLSQFACIFTK